MPVEEVAEMMENSELGSQEGVKKQEISDDDQSPRGVHEIPVSCTDTDDPTCSNNSSSGDKLATQLSIIRDAIPVPWKSIVCNLKKKSASARRFSSISITASYELTAKSWRKTRALIRSADDSVTLPKPSWRNFNYKELARATSNFCPENMIGKGGHAEVYKGFLSDGEVVAVKRLIKIDEDDEIRTGDFLSELGIIAHIDHPNAARLIGFGTDGGFHLVLKFTPNGSLSTLLHGNEPFEWSKRFKIVLGVAEGLKYLHHECHRRIIHRDIKASNILLTEDYEAQISDFGLAKWLPEKWAYHVFFPIEGTFGYLAPEYFMHGIADEKTDVFAFGVLLLEIITGRQAVDSHSKSLAKWAKPLLEENNVKEVADPRLGDDYDTDEMHRAMLTASKCINHSSKERPHMNRVVQLLQGEHGPMEQKQKSIVREFNVDATEVEDHTSRTYMDNLNRHMQLVME